MQWFFDKLEGYRSLVLTYLASAMLYVDKIRETLSEVTSLMGMPLNESASIGAFVAAAMVTVKVVIDRWRKAV